jgi:hypothetical protein
VTQALRRRRGAAEDNPTSFPQAITRGLETITEAIEADARESCRLDALE